MIVRNNKHSIALVRHLFHCSLAVFIALLVLQRLDIGLAYGQTPQAPERVKAQKRVALVIGNSSYATNPLAFATNDANDMAEALSELGFDVSLLVDATQIDMTDAIKGFIPRAKSADVALFYFSGHGEQVISSSGVAENFLIPVDVRPGMGESNIKNSILVLKEIINELATSTEDRMSIVILDACRSRAATQNADIEARLPSLFQGGLAKMALPSGTFVAYGAAPGTYAFESPDSQHGRFTNSLLKHMRTPGLFLEQVFRRVRSDVERDSNMVQSPREETSLRGHQDFYFVDPAIKSARKRGQVMNLSAAGLKNKALTTTLASGNRTETSSLIAAIQHAPAVSRMRTLRNIVAMRAPKFHVQEVEAILTYFWVTGRFTAFDTMIDSLPEKMSLDDAGRVTAIALHFPLAIMQQHPKEIYENLRQRGKLDPSIAFSDFDRVRREKDQQNGRCAKSDLRNIHASTDNIGISEGNTKLFQILGNESMLASKRMEILHDVFHNQNVELSAAETVALLGLFPAEARTKILTEEIWESIPDLLSWGDVIEILQLIPVSKMSSLKEAWLPRYSSFVAFTWGGHLDATLTENQQQRVEQLIQEENSELWAGAKRDAGMPLNGPFSTITDQIRDQQMKGTLDPYKPCE